MSDLNELFNKFKDELHKYQRCYNVMRELLLNLPEYTDLVQENTTLKAKVAELENKETNKKVYVVPGKSPNVKLTIQENTSPVPYYEMPVPYYGALSGDSDIPGKPRKPVLEKQQYLYEDSLNSNNEPDVNERNSLPSLKVHNVSKYLESRGNESLSPHDKPETEEFESSMEKDEGSQIGRVYSEETSTLVQEKSVDIEETLSHGESEDNKESVDIDETLSHEESEDNKESVDIEESHEASKDIEETHTLVVSADKEEAHVKTESATKDVLSDEERDEDDNIVTLTNPKTNKDDEYYIEEGSNGVKYIYELTPEDEIGSKVGKFVNGKPVFYKK